MKRKPIRASGDDWFHEKILKNDDIGWKEIKAKRKVEKGEEGAIDYTAKLKAKACQWFQSRVKARSIIILHGLIISKATLRIPNNLPLISLLTFFTR